ncbi:Crp/Fnr family transcriptional regulator [Listeria fleischmannii]|jgi:CRP-like cAMP-binding protein|uniref:Crp/Fnr family transcriptional regulator n=2 Tax=Listeria fleischmannii TaxID=1069827 RepID=A0A841YEA0_9LIST|nr:Crp/Fnr family transcriptional regulator [Listeria fleischmannii]EIA18936.1 Crp/FNR family transcriptional regulator [Listeria fleischmannii subsp. coloradonensis]EUJ52251.1 putative regulator of the Fnr CRP family protein [Listeria fleischmannii FSL S10-1203]MBC1398712.1 Crp/Fnr family transcriptional regulator [Listeria fleischmannii]MBC1418171.1 Crp/Fnr family transcriptional regulator [Listeria fleischmannii]MBC1426944.1 Crp/Fnr family transcriptional regulator [Listeria fleischmannii]
MKSEALSDYVEQHAFSIITKEKKKYLTYEGLQDSFVYILKEGIVKTSLISKDGREFNLEYINRLDIVSLLRDEYSQFTNAPFNIRVESDVAVLYKIDRVQFWKDVNSKPELQAHVKDYYRMRLLKAIKRMQQMLMNGKIGAVCTHLYTLYELFGVPVENGHKIDFIVTNEEIARFCGVTSASSVNRMLQQLKAAGAIDIEERYIVIRNLALIQENIIL